MIHIVVGNSVQGNFVLIIVRLYDPQVVVNAAFLVNTSEHVIALLEREP